MTFREGGGDSPGVQGNFGPSKFDNTVGTFWEKQEDGLIDWYSNFSHKRYHFHGRLDNETKYDLSEKENLMATKKRLLWCCTHFHRTGDSFWLKIKFASPETNVHFAMAFSFISHLYNLIFLFINLKDSGHFGNFIVSGKFLIWGLEIKFHS